MSYIPNTRKKYIEPLFRNTQGGRKIANEPNPYYEGKLTPENQIVMLGYDQCVADVETVLCDIEELFDFSEVDVRPSDIKAVIDAITEQFLEHLEDFRNIQVVTLIDTQEPDVDFEEYFSAPPTPVRLGKHGIYPADFAVPDYDPGDWDLDEE